MIRISKTVLPSTDNPYAVGYLSLGGDVWGICASGSRGSSLAFPADAPEKAVRQELHPANWGAQMFCPADENSYFAIQGFLPEFQCENSCLVRITKDGEHWRVEHCFAMPFLHKIAVAESGGRKYLLCATLSGPKDFKEDWSRPGAVWVSPIPDDPTAGGWSFSRILYPMTKNHGFCCGLLDGKETFFFSASEGTWAVRAPQTPKSDWWIERLFDFEIGDLSVFEDIVAAVDGFHGDSFSLYRRTGGRLLTTPLTWGHTAWLGRVGGIPIAVAGELEGEQRIMFFADFGKGFQLIRTESRIGPFSVCPRFIDENVLELLCPARAAGSPLIYRVEVS